MRWRMSTFAALALCLGALSQAATSAPQTPGEPGVVAEARRSQKSGDYQQAAKEWRSIVDADPSNAEAWYNLGYSLHAAGRIEEAVLAHEKAAAFDSFASTAGYNLACALSLLGRSEASLDALEAAVEAGFVNAALAGTDSDLDPIRGDARFRAILDGIGLPLARRLHFWIGEWDCYSVNTGKINGYNELVARVDEKVIHENWSPVGGGANGESWNYYDPSSRTWRQHWMDPGGHPLVYVGTPKENGILFEGPHQDGKESASRKRMFIRPIGNGRVQQTGTQSTDGGKTWGPEFDLIYVPRGEPFGSATSGAPAKTASAAPARQFDFLIGDWRMDVEQYDPQGDVIRRLSDWSRVRPMIGGASLIDEWGGSGFTVRTWDPAQNLWRLFWTDRNGSAGRMQMWEGTFEDGVGTFVGGMSVPAQTSGTTVSSKIEFSEIQDDSVLWKMWKSPDAGETWVLDYIRRYTRVSG